MCPKTNCLHRIITSFSLPQYERTFVTSGFDNLYFDIKESYSSKILQQFNVLILALTVVGNPYGFNFKQCGNTPHGLNVVSREG